MSEELLRELEQLASTRQSLRRTIHLGYEMGADPSYLDQLDVALFAIEIRERKLNEKRAKRFVFNKN